MTRALSNLIYNALDAVEPGGAIRITDGAADDAEARRDATHVYIRVEDDGPGIEAAALQRIFDPFFTTKDDGTGLGLAIVHRVAESNGGFVTAGNRTGGGAVFVLSIPRAAGDPESKRRGGIE
jgi:signal transduction histidine kinase